MPATIYVPQGKVARLTQESIKHKIEGLYTDGFSTCNIVVCIGKEKIILAHVDQLTNFQEVVEEMKWVDNPKETVVIYGKGQEEGITTKLLSEGFKAFLPSQPVSIKVLDDKYEGIFVSFSDQKEEDIHKKIKKYPVGENPNGLIRHPHEQQLEAVVKIEQIVGLKAKIKKENVTQKKICIFDSLMWEHFNAESLKINEASKDTQKEMDVLRRSKNMPFLEQAANLLDIMEKHKKEGVEIGKDFYDIALMIAFYVEGYLNEYDPIVLFKKNVKELFCLEQYVPESQQDKKLKEKILNTVDKPGDQFDTISSIFNEYKSASPATTYKEEMLVELNTLNKHYQLRNRYRKMEAESKEKIEMAVKMNEAGRHEFVGNKNYQAAANLFFDAICLLIQAVTKNNSVPGDNNLLASLFFNYGRAMQKLEKRSEAKHYFMMSSDLRVKYDPKNEKELAKIKKAIDECSQIISVSVVGSHQQQAEVIQLNINPQ